MAYKYLIQLLKLDANMGSAASVPKLRGETIFMLTIEFEVNQ